MSPKPDSIRLIVRGDDIGSSRAANHACIDAYTKGIMTTVELMPPCPWFPEAARLLRENPGLDVGIHCSLTAEWEGMKWRPLTPARSIVDEDGFFFPMIHPNANFPAERTLRGSDWRLEEIEAELRAQIELARRHVPHASHVSCHMGCAQWDESVKAMFTAMAKDLGLWIAPAEQGCQRFEGYRGAEGFEAREALFIERLADLTPGLWMFVDHPAYDTPESRGLGHTGYEDVAADRDACTRVFTSPEVKAAIEERGIELIAYRDLR
ncbi:MAG: ChbG/HpnK family deacetylase [Puniceicoccaceae bacterium]|nr:MAG: ChbG/HpnK family deacetylase [Puniceicoccaceae bacterium]